MKKIWNFLVSTRMMAILVILYAFSMIVATFVENDFGTQSAKALIYNSWWFEGIMYLLTLNFIGNVFRYKLYRREKLPIFVFHIAFIVTLLGAFVTRYFGYEGLMPIREGSVSNTILSDKTYIEATVDNGKEQKDYEKEVLFGALNSNYFKIKSSFRGVPFKIEYADFIPNAKSVFKADPNGKPHLHLVFSGGNGRQDMYIPNQEIVQIGSQFFSYNKPMQGVMNFVDTDGLLLFQPAEDGTFMEMQTQNLTSIPKDSVLPAQFLKLYYFPSTQFVIKEAGVKGENTVESAHGNEKKMYQYDALYLNVSSGNETQQIILQGAKNSITEPERLSLNGLNFVIKYGAKEIHTPFALKLRDFQLERYPGTNSPSSYASEVTVMDQKTTFDYRIYMNHVLDYKGFRFFQSSYDPDELGTVLSVNHDYWGTLITYIGYFLMALGMFFTLFWKGSRFSSLVEKLNKLYKNKTTIFLLLFGFSATIFAQQPDTKKYVVSAEHARKFGELLIQDHGGRFKPVNTYALEALRKVYKKDTYQGLTADQVLLSAQIDPYAWGEEYIIHVKPNILGSKMAHDLKEKNGYTSAANFYQTGNYYLLDKTNEIAALKNSDRNATDKEIVNLDERFNVWAEILNGSLLHIYPKENDPNNKWYAGTDQTAFVAQDTMVLKMHQLYLQSLVNAVKTNDYKDADFYLDIIKGYQKKIGGAIIPSDKKIDLELKYNRWNIFKKLMMFYLPIGAIFLILAFVELFAKRKRLLNYTLKLFTFVVIMGLILHGIGLGVRWYVSEHAPWSNAYEAMIFVSFVAIIAGLLFSYKKSKFILAAAIILASLLMGIAHGNSMNPEMTNLVPVLKSYWLNIHVAVISGSYAFLGLGSLLALLVMLFYIIRTKANAEKLDKISEELTHVNEMTLTVGLFALSIGTFLGGVWANESWGRYWSWDPKEVWSLISMMVYVFVLHMRIVPGLRGKFAFNLLALWSIATLIMTFFGVNYYLSGMHSYAGGDKVPVPTWAYYALVFFIVFSMVSYWRYSRMEKK